MKCSQCGFDNGENAKFCSECGTKLARMCPGCGEEAAPGAKFCSECGTSLLAPVSESPAPESEVEASPAPTAESAPVVSPSPTPHATSEGEHKQVTVMSCELTTSPAGEAELDPEFLYGQLSRFLELARAEVERYEGTISQFLGNGFIASFGALVAHEDHPHRAALAALGLRQLLMEQQSELAEQHGAHLSFRMGLDTGGVVVGGAGGMIVGDATVSAARLRDAAATDTILMGLATRRLLPSSFEVRASEDVSEDDAHELLGDRSWLETDDFEKVQLSPFVGRDQDLAVLEQLVEQATEGRGQAVGITGEAGAGKSRLLRELRARLSGRPVVYLRGHCLSYGSGVPYLPLLHMIRKASRIRDSDSAEQISEKIRNSLVGVGIEPENILPYFLWLLGVDGSAGALSHLEPQALQAQSFVAMRQMIHRASQRGLVLIELEDLHWVDETSEAFLASLAEGLSAARILLLVTYRSGYRPAWMEKSYATQLNMRPLSKNASEQVVRHVLAKASLPDDHVTELLAKAEGNPLFLEELARSFSDRSSETAVPDTIQGLLMSRVDRLPELHKRLLQCASVLGRESSLELLEALWDREDELDPLLRDLTAREFFYEAPSVEGGTYFFKHALIQDVSYQSLLKQRREALHLEAAEALERIHADRLEDVYDLLVQHYPKAGNAAKTVYYLTLFARRAAGSYAHAEAAKAFREALTHAAKLPEEDRDRQTIELLVELAESLLPLAALPETLEVCERYRDTLEHVEDRSLHAKYHFWLAHTHTYLGNQGAAVENAEKAIEHARESGDQATEGKACYVLGRDGFWAGSFPEAIEHSRRAVALLERSGEPWWQGQAYWVAGYNHYALGDFEAALASLGRAYEIGEALADERLDTSWSIGFVYASLGEVDAGIEECVKGLDQARDPLNIAAARGFLGFAYLEKGDLPAAIEQLEASVEQMEAAGMRQLLGWFSALLAEARLGIEDLESASRTAEEALGISREANFRFGVALAQRALAKSAVASNPQAAEGLLDQALASFEELEVPFEAGRMHLEKMRFHHAQGDAEGAARAAQKARDIFASLKVASYVARAEQARIELGLPEFQT